MYYLYLEDTLVRSYIHEDARMDEYGIWFWLVNIGEVVAQILH